jgi:tetratricopeptide (TPR) repeat protein
MDALPPSSGAWYAAAGEVAHAAGARANRPRLVELVAALEAAAGPDVSGAEVAACARLARQLLFAGRPDLARRLRERLAGARPETLERDPVAAGRIRYIDGLVALFAGDPAQYLRECEAALGFFELGGDLRNACAQQSFVGYGLMEVGRYAEAERRLRDTVERADRMGLPPVAAHARHNLGLVLHRLGADDEARRVEEEAAVELARQGDRRLAGFARVYLARILAASGDLVAAEREARVALRVLEAVPSVRPAAFAVLGQVLAAAGRADEAAEAADEAVQMMKSAGVEEGEALVRLVHAESLHARGLHEAALAAITTAREQLLARSALISDDALKRSFLENVPEHVRTITLAQEWKSAF